MFPVNEIEDIHCTHTTEKPKQVFATIQWAVASTGGLFEYEDNTLLCMVKLQTGEHRSVDIKFMVELFKSAAYILWFIKRF